MTRIFHAESPYAGFPHLFIATPVTEKPSPAYMFSMWQAAQALAAAGIAVDLYLMVGNCHVDDARNGCLRDFKATKCTDLVFIDGDVGFSAKDLVRIATYTEDIVAGVYPKKTPDGAAEEFTVEFDPGIELGPNGLLKVTGAPTGFMKIRRHVIEALIDANKDRQWLGQNDSPGASPYTEVFRRMFIDGRRRSGDFAFCAQWRALGGDVFVDPEIDFVHEGPKEWVGNFGQYRRFLRRERHPKMLAAIAALRGGDTDAAHFADLFVHWGNPFAATPEMLFACFMAAREAKGPILETGSGLSTIVMALAAPKGVVVHALEHDPDYMRQTALALQEFEIPNVALHYAPLRDHDNDLTWYGIDTEMPERFELVICDGPQGRFGRTGLFKLFGDHIAPSATVLCDDADRAHEFSEIAEWAERNGRAVAVLGTQRLFASISPSILAAAA